MRCRSEMFCSRSVLNSFKRGERATRLRTIGRRTLTSVLVFRDDLFGSRKTKISKKVYECMLTITPTSTHFDVEDKDFDQNRLSQKRSATDVVQLANAPDVLSSDDLERLRENGLRIAISCVYVKDGLLHYRGQRVALYYRAEAPGSDDTPAPKYHFAECHNLMSFARKPRARDYIVFTREEGDRRGISESLAHVGSTSSSVSLDACKNCKRCTLGPKFSFRLEEEERSELRAVFYLSDLFRVCALDRLRVLLLDEYTDDWHDVKCIQRNAKGWTCEACRKDFSEASLRRYLHVHHVDRNKQNNESHNLRVLCVRCHGDQDGHEGIKNGRNYRKYCKLFPK
jgi:hypothetical protein